MYYSNSIRAKSSVHVYCLFIAGMLSPIPPLLLLLVMYCVYESPLCCKMDVSDGMSKIVIESVSRCYGAHLIEF